MRGTTSVKIVRMMREAGAREVHFRISSPPIQHPDYYGIDTPKPRDAAGGVARDDEPPPARRQRRGDCADGTGITGGAAGSGATQGEGGEKEWRGNLTAPSRPG